MRARLSLLLVIALTASLLAGCASTSTPTPTTTATPGGSSTATTTATPAPSSGAAVTVGTTDTITSLDPGKAYEFLSINILENTMGTLVANKPNSADLVPELASALPTVSADGLNYTFKIRADAKYSDGTAVKASDFLWALQRNSGPVGGKEGDPAFLIYDSGSVDIKNSTASDADGTLVLHLKHPAAYLSSMLIFPNFAPLPKAKYTDAAWVEPTGITTNLPISSGPYSISEYKQGEYVKLAKNPSYNGPRVAKTDTVTIKLFSTSASMQAALQNKEIDVAFHDFSPDEWKNIKGLGGGLKTSEASGAGSRIRYLAFNANKTGDQQDAKVRQAIAYIVDRNKINDVVFSGTVVPAYSIIAPGLLGSKDVYKDIYGASPNVDAAKTLLDAAGFSSSKKVTFDLWFNSDNHYGPTEPDIAQLIKTQLEATGYFTVNLKQEPWKQFRTDSSAGNFPVFLIGWFPDYLDPDDYVAPFLTPAGGAQYGTYYTNATMQPFILKEQSSSANAEREAALLEIQRGAAYDNPQIPLYLGQQQVAYVSGVSGVVLSPTSIFPYYTLAK